MKHTRYERRTQNMKEFHLIVAEIAQQSRAQVLSSASSTTSDGSQLPVTPAPGNLPPSSGFLGHSTYVHTHTKTHTENHNSKLKILRSPFI